MPTAKQKLGAVKAELSFIATLGKLSAMREDDHERVCRRGTAAWKRLKRQKNWADWIEVGEALEAGRDWAMHQAGTNEPAGKAYNMTFGEWLRTHQLDDMDKGERARLFTVMENRAAIEEWRATLTLTERLKLNHPNAVLRKWQKFIEPEDKDKASKPTLQDSVVQLGEENAAKDKEIAHLKAHVTELEAARGDPIEACIAALQAMPLHERRAALERIAREARDEAAVAG
jgi:hypothetical protein